MEVLSPLARSVVDRDKGRKQSYIETRKSVQLIQSEIVKQSKEIWITKQFVENPFKVILFFSLLFIISLFCVIQFNLMEMTQQGTRDFLIWEDIRVQEYDMITKMEKVFQESINNSEVPERSQEAGLWTTSIMIVCQNCDNVLQVKHLKILKEMELYILSHEQYPTLCLASTTNSNCSPQGVHSLFTDEEVNSQESIDKVIDQLLSDEERLQQHKKLFGTDFNISGNKKTTVFRSIIKFGLPLEIDGKKYKSQYDDFSSQKAKFNEFCEDIIQKREQIIEKQDLDGIEIIPFNLRVDSLQFKKVVDSDFMWALASMVFVWLYISIHLKSVFLGSFAMLNIMFSFPLTFIVYRYVLQITFFSSLHILAIFLVLGIAADDVFIFMDAWHQTGLIKEISSDLNKRMVFAYKRSAKAMLATSSTTSAAFLATGLSEIMPISSFGFFAGVLIPMNYFLVITFFPALMIVQEKYLKSKKKKSTRAFQYQQKDPQNAPPIGVQQITKSSKFKQNNEEKEENEGEKEHKIEKFLHDQFNTFVFKGRYLWLGLISLWTLIAIWRATLLSPLSEPENFLPSDYYTEIGKKLLFGGFQKSGSFSSGIIINMFWGVDGIDKEGVSKWDSTNLGNLEWDEQFDLSKEENQVYYIRVCQYLRSNRDIVQDGEVICIMEYFAQWREMQGLSFPVPQNQFTQAFTQFSLNPIGGLPFYNDNLIGIIDNKVKYICLIASSVGTKFRPYNEMYPLYDRWQREMDNINNQAPKGFNKGRQTAYFDWSWMMSEKAFAKNAILGMTISLLFGLFVLIIFTKNIIVSLFSILSIGGIVVSVIAVMELQGWELGIAESLTVVILIGLSVDYVVHLANHYVECPYLDRYRKTQISIKEIGVSILSGALTTIGSGVFLFFGKILMFNKFAILISATILFSLLYSMLFFTSLLHICGPQAGLGQITCFCLKKLNKQKKRQYKPDKQNENQELKQITKNNGNLETTPQQDNPTQRFSTQNDNKKPFFVPSSQDNDNGQQDSVKNEENLVVLDENLSIDTGNRFNKMENPGIEYNNINQKNDIQK